MSKKSSSPLADLPSVDRLLQTDSAAAMTAEFGRTPATDAIRRTLDDIRTAVLAGGNMPDEMAILSMATKHLTEVNAPSLRPVYNLTGTVLHTNLGRAALP